eukprot:7835373-Pyramimonas_sp.AAC.1
MTRQPRITYKRTRIPTPGWVGRGSSTEPEMGPALGKTTLFRKRSNENESISSVSKSRSSRVGFLGLVRAADDMVTARYGNVSRRDSSLLVSSEVGVALPTVLFAARAHRRAY